jgi:type II secretory pathway component PulJ
MKKTSSHAQAGLEKRYDQLRQKLARTGYISRGSVLARSVATSGRSGYQWTRKVAGKTVSVSLSPEQFKAMKQAVSNQRELRRTIDQMEKISRQLLFQTAADTHRRKPLGKRVLGTI